MKIKKGATRIVIVLSTIVIKFPNFLNGYKFVLQGLLANLAEKDWWGILKDNRLCPVIFTSWFGLFSIMKRAHMTGDIESEERFHEYFKGLPYDPHSDNIGIFNGELCLVDYGCSIEKIYCPNCLKFLDEVYEK